MVQEHFDVVVVGSGFGSVFFVEGNLNKRPAARILMLERGTFASQAWQLENGRNSSISTTTTYRTDLANKVWNFTIGVGGGTNCWYAQTPRFHPSDFRMRSKYGVAQDWPVDYDELDPYYFAAETKMSVAGSPEMGAVLPRSAPFPQPPHKPTAVDAIMRQAQPQFHMPIATARASVATAGRPPCCASARCNLCPVNAKFTFENGFANLRQLPNVEIRTECEVTHLDHAIGAVRAAAYRKDGAEHQVTGDLFVLGANAIHSPAILLRSGIDHPLTGVGIHEQVGYGLEVLLDGLDNLDGGTITTALNFSLYDGPFCKEHAG